MCQNLSDGEVMRMLVALCTGQRYSENGRKVKRHHPVARCEV